MNDLISREKAISAIGSAVYDYNPAMAKLSESVLLNLPAIEAQPLKHGRWIENFNDYENYCICSECGESPDSPLDETPYCPYCGAQMDEDRTMNDPTAIYQTALDTWGAESQTIMVFEEMSELQKELCKNLRGRKNRDEIAEEIADVQIMLEQMILLHDCKSQVQEWRVKKLERLADRIKETNLVTQS